MSNNIEVRGNKLSFAGKTYRCAIGKNGITANKKEGDGATPSGIFLLRECWYRADRIRPILSHLPLRRIQLDDGWCDDPKSDQYNRHVKLPFVANHEILWRDDAVYDLIIPLGYNDNSIISGKGSAIFMHVAKPDYSGTEGCVALSTQDLLEILPHLTITTQIEIL